jgi:hypothetical protein
VTYFLRKERTEKKGDKHQNQRREKKGDKHRNPTGTKRNQQIMMEQNPFPEERKKAKEGRQARNPNRNQEEAANHEGTKAVTSKN